MIASMPPSDPSCRPVYEALVKALARRLKHLPNVRLVCLGAHAVQEQNMQDVYLKKHGNKRVRALGGAMGGVAAAEGGMEAGRLERRRSENKILFLCHLYRCSFASDAQC